MVAKAYLVERQCTLRFEHVADACAALGSAVDC